MTDYTYADLCEKCGAEIELIPDKWIVCNCGNKYKLTIKLEIIDPDKGAVDTKNKKGD